MNDVSAVKIGRIDLWLFGAVLLLLVFSAASVYSASITISEIRHGAPDAVYKSHILRVVLALVALLIGVVVDYRIYMRLSKIAIIMGVALLVLTLFEGTVVNGARRWLELGPLKFQPSEFVKYALVFHIATIAVMKNERIGTFKDGFLKTYAWIMISTVLIIVQPNFSTAAVVLLIGTVMAYACGVKVKYIGASLAAALPLVVLYAFSAPYRVQRIVSFFGLGDGSDTRVDASRYQVEQAIIGLGSGGIMGVGMGMSKQRELFLPESYSDFVFAIVGEEYGFIGALLILFLFALITLRGVRIAKNVQDDYGRYLAFGITSVIAIYSIINAGVSVGLLPTTGLPMPFISYGGTSLIISGYVVGVLLNISTNTRIRPRAYEEAAADA
ncbi:MAG: cell cycle protein [Ectothiorhodospiraceae bacterium]|nr:cell cycle protein [Ectothiorhodospiraceae bacterium]